MKKRISIIFMCIVLMLTSFNIPISAAAADSTENVDRLYTRTEVNEYRNAGTYPSQKGYVFAGWYQDSSHETPVIGNTPLNGAYAKFVNEKVLTILFQLKNETTSQSATTDLRVITSVDSLLYQQVGFKLQVEGNSNESEITSKTVYKTIATYSDDEQQKYQPKDVFDATDSEYFVTKVLTGIKNTSFKKEISFKPFWVTMDGTQVTGTERTIKLLDAVPFVANPLGFIAGQHDAPATTVERTTFDGKEVVRANFRKVLFQDVIDANKEQGEFFDSEYTHVQFDVYLESVNSDKIMVNTSQASLEAAYANGKCSDWTGEENKGEFVRTYKDGVRANLEVGAWYTVCMKVTSGSTDVSFCSPGTRSVAYMKNLTFTNAFPEDQVFAANPLGFIAGQHDAPVTTVEKTTFGGEEVIKANFRKVLFQDVIDANNDKGEFFDSEYTHVEFDVYLESVNAEKIMVNTSQASLESAYANGKCSDWTGDENVEELVRTYKDGVRAPIDTGAWYTVYMKVASTSSEVNICASNGAATIYLKNLTFANDFPEEGEFTANPLGFVAGNGSTTVTSVTMNGETVIKAEGSKVCFQDVMTASGDKGQFFNEGYRYVTFMGRVTSGEGGTILLARAKEVLEKEYPELAKTIELHIPDEKSRRVGQSVAAASLPKI